MSVAHEWIGIDDAQERVEGRQGKGRCPYGIVELVGTGVEDHPPVLNDAVQNPFQYCKVLDEGFDLSRFRGDNIALLDEL